MKVLFLILHRKDRSPGQRYRHEQYVTYLERNGIACHFEPLLTTAHDDLIFYGRKTIPKVFVGLKAFFRRVKNVLQASNFDAVYIYRDAFFFSTFFEKWLKSKKVKIIYDFDDAIWLMDKNENQGFFNKLKNPEKTALITQLSDVVIVGNEYLSTYAQNLNHNVSIIPSTIDFKSYHLLKPTKKDDSRICIGWTGSFSTVKHFETLIPVLHSIKHKFGKKIHFKLIGDPDYKNDPLEIIGHPWKSETESEDLSELDIGIMPLPNNEWTQGKCGMKGLQYMALEIPTIMSPVGVNKDIIDDGVNGFLASTDEEWVEKLTLLIEHQELRQKIGKAGRKTVEEKYSVKANQEKWLHVFESLKSQS